MQAPPVGVNGPARHGCIEDGDGGDKDQALVGSRIGAVLPGEKNQRNESQNVESGNGKERPGAGPIGVTGQGIDGCENRENGHGAGQAEAKEAKTAVNIHPARGDQQRLRDEKKNPTGEDCAVNMDKSIGKPRLENTGKIIRLGKANKDGDKNQQHHGREEEMVVAASGR